MLKQAVRIPAAARGVVVDPRWLKYENFLEDMGRRPSAEHTVERKNNEFGYSKDNCEWATREVQNNHTSRNRMLNFNGRTQTLTQWAREVGLRAEVIRKRLALGWPVEKALTAPVDAGYVRSCATS